MKVRKAIPMFILLFTGYLCKKMNVTAQTTDSFSPTEAITSSHSFVPASKVTQAPKSETTSEPTSHGNDHHPGGHHSTIVAAISISMVLLFLLLIGLLYARKRRSSAEMDSVPSGEPGVYLERISTHEN